MNSLSITLLMLSYLLLRSASAREFELIALKIMSDLRTTSLNPSTRQQSTVALTSCWNNSWITFWSSESLCAWIESSMLSMSFLSAMVMLSRDFFRSCTMLLLFEKSVVDWRAWFDEVCWMSLPRNCCRKNGTRRRKR